MFSLRTKISLMTVFVLIVTVIAMSVLCVVYDKEKSDNILLLLCKTGASNLDSYFTGAQKSVEEVSSFAQEDVTELDDKEFNAHVERVRDYFGDVVKNTGGVLTYYYRIDLEVSDNVKGFWYINLDHEGFVEHEVTDITQYDTSDTSKLVWFTVPKYEGKAIWLPPYITDNLNRRVISYNTPVYCKGRFIGVIGIEIDYSTMAEQVESIKLHSNGYAFLSDAKGNLFYHPRIDVTQLTKETMPEVPEGVVSSNTFFRYTYDGIEKKGAWLELSNGMRMNVVVPVSELESDLNTLILTITVFAIVILSTAVFFTMFYTKRIVKPLEQLTAAAEQVNKGNYDFSLDYDKDDEVGKLTRTFKLLTNHVKDDFRDLNKRVFADALTKVKNKAAYAADLEELQAQTDTEGSQMQFAIGIFDCDNLKKINDMYGHDKGDEYIKAACRAICTTFRHSPVYRFGGDEFSVILRNEDYQNREALISQFEATAESINKSTENQWEQVHISMGFADYDPQNDSDVNDVVRRADKMMYDNKRMRKNA